MADDPYEPGIPEIEEIAPPEREVVNGIDDETPVSTPTPAPRHTPDLRAITLVGIALIACVIMALVLSLPPGPGAEGQETTPTRSTPPTPTPAYPAGAILVSAADSTNPGRQEAQFVCDGTDDQLEIQQALAAAGSGKGTVVLLDGTFHCTDRILPTAGATLQGLGAGRTTLDVQGYYKPIEVLKDGVTLRDFRVTGRGFILVRASHILVERVTITTMQSGRVEANGAFFVFAKDSVIEDIEFRNCIAVDCGIHGFNVNGQGSPKETRNLRYIDCTALRCGNENSRAVWTTGFDFHETNDLYGLTVLRCRAEDNWESGFHFEPGGHVTPKTIAEDIWMEDCISIGNGHRNTKPYPYSDTFSSGYYVHNNAVIINCTSEKNKNAGFFVHGGRNATFEECSDVGSTYGFKIVKDSREVTLRNCATSNNLEWGLWAAWADRLVLSGFTQKNVTGKDGYQSILGWYYRNPDYEKPVKNSRFEIAADGDLPILNEAGTNNRYDLTRL